MAKLSAAFLVFAACVGSLLAADLTRQPNAYGPDVVEAVVNIIRESCLFADDKRFLRRLAYVESQDGQDPQTYRFGYYGGIWQVDESAFLTTQNLQSLIPQYNIIRNNLGIDWSTVTWSDLRKPLYSGIAAALYTIARKGASEISWKKEEQGNFWGDNFHGGSPAYNFSQLAELLDLGCHVNQQTDLVFVLDTSSSLTHDDFLRAQQFIKEVVKGFNIGSTETQVAVVTYSTNPHVDFYLNSHWDKASVLSAIDKIPFRPGGTQTNQGIDTAVSPVFTSVHGARSNAVPVMIVITDGQSDDDINTRHAAERAHAAGIVTFSVGIGNTVDQSELNTIATNPSCTHSFRAASFEEIKFMKEEIQKATCIAPLFINKTYSCEVSRCPPLAVVTGTGGVTLEMNMTCGGINVFSSSQNPYPTSAQFEKLNVVLGTDGNVIEYYNVSGKTVYLNLKDNQGIPPYYNASTGCIATVTPCFGDCTPKVPVMTCYLDGVEVPCNNSCNENWNFPNPCTKENLLAGKDRFPHPYESNKFLMCDLSQKLYIVICPEGELFYPDCSQCIGPNTVSSSNCLNPLPSNITNPCSRQNILEGHMYFPFPDNEHKYIHCDLWGKPWERDCQVGMSWDQSLLTCIESTIIYSPCAHHVPGTPYLYPHLCDPHQYIHCDTNHQTFIQSCQLDFVFLQVSQTCVPIGFPGSENLVYTCNGANIPVLSQTTVPSNGVTPNGYEHSSTLWVAPCDRAHIAANELYFPYKYDVHKYIQCDLNGRQYLRQCPPGDPYYDPYSFTCVDGPVFVDNIVG